MRLSWNKKLVFEFYLHKHETFKSHSGKVKINSLSINFARVKSREKQFKVSKFYKITQNKCALIKQVMTILTSYNNFNNILKVVILHLYLFIGVISLTLYNFFSVFFLYSIHIQGNSGILLEIIC